MTDAETPGGDIWENKRKMSEKSEMKVYLMGFGPGDKRLVTVKAMESLRASGLILGPERLLSEAADLLGEDSDDPGLNNKVICQGEGSTGIFCGERRLTEVKTYTKDALDIILRYFRDGNKAPVSVLYGGDCGFWSGAPVLSKLLSDNRIGHEMLPGISSLQYFAARLKEGWQEWRLQYLQAHKPPREQREAVALAVVEDVPYETVSEILGVPLGTVKSRVYYGLKALRETLQRQGYQSGAF